MVGFSGSSSVIDFYGSNFMLNGNTLTGLLADNSVLNVNLFVGNTGTVLFNGAPLTEAAVPEPATAMLGTLAVAAMTPRRRRRY